MKNKYIVLSVLIPILIFLVGCSKKTNNGQIKSISMVESPALASSGEPNLSATSDGGAILSWIEKDSNDVHLLKFSSWKNSSWDAPRMIASGNDWFVNWADFPAVAAKPDGSMMASWLQKSAASTYAYDINLALSQNGGVDWSDQFILHDDGTPTEHGFVSMIPLDNNQFAVTWLDGRQTINEDGAMTLRYATISSDGTISDTIKLDERVCDCCQTSMAQPGDGSLLICYRDRSDMEVRDISIVRQTGTKWSLPQAVHNDGWEIEGCPVNGPAVAANDSLVAVAWYTMGNDDSSKVLCAFSSDYGKRFGTPIHIDSGDPEGRVDLLFIDEQTALVSWLEYTGDTARVAVRTVRPDGVVSDIVTVTMTSGSRLSGFTRMALTVDGVAIAWTELSDPPIVKTALVKFE